MGTVIGTVLPAKLRSGDLIRVVAPSLSLQLISEDVRPISDRRLAELGLRVDFGEHVREHDAFTSSSVASRVADLHAAFADPEVDAIICLRGGYGTPRLLDRIDFELLQNNAKPFIGYSDITALHVAISRYAGFVTFHGPLLNADLLGDKQKPTESSFFNMLRGEE
jgi:muramoyltetrapeptide carboxypeptidase